MEASSCVGRSRDEIACGGSALPTIGDNTTRPNQQTTFEQSPGRARRKTANSASDDDQEDELETTNCSETMVSSGGEQQEQEERLRPRRHLNGASHSTIERQRLQSGRNRLGTPRHEIARRHNQQQRRDAAQTADCDRVQSNDFILISNSSNQDDQDEQPDRQLDNESSEFSLASGQNQGPPSYGTATRSCATLDVGQLQQFHLRRLQQQAQQSAQWQTARQINQLDRNQQTRPTASGTESEQAVGQTSGGLNYVSLGNLAAILNQQQRRLTQPGGPQSIVPLEAAGRPIDDSYGFLRPDKDLSARHQQQQWRRPPAQVGLDLAAPSATLQRQLELMAMSAAITGSVNGPAPGSGQSLVKKRDEGIYATLNVTQANSNHIQQQQRTQTTTTTTTTRTGNNGHLSGSGPFATPPPLPVQINHVISAPTSMQPPSQQQQQLQLSAGPIWVASGVAQPQVNQLNGGLGERLFDFHHSTTTAATSSGSGRQWSPNEADLMAASDGQQQAQNQTLASSGQQQQNWHANDLANAKQTGASQSQINGQTNDQKSKRTCPQAAANNRQQLQSLSMTKPTTRQQRRRRHKSTSGATLFNSSARDESNPMAREYEFARRDAEWVASTSKAQHQTTRATISAHCWLIDSNDENDDRDEARRTQRRHAAAGRSVSSLGQDRLKARTLREPLKPLFGGSRTQVGGGKRSTSSTLARVGATRRRVHQTGSSQSATALNVTDFVSGSELDDLEGQENEVAEALERQRQAPTRRRGPRSCVSSSSTAYSNASAVVRLSAMLSFVSQLVSGRSTRSTRSVSSNVSSSKPELRSRRVAESNCSSSTSFIQHDEGTSAMGPTVSTSSQNQQQQYNTGAASSLAYSSSTSAYVTGNSSLHSHDCGSSFVHIVQRPDRTTAPPAPQGHPQRPESLMATGNTLPSARSCQEFYRLDSKSNDQRAGSHHSYEYCADFRSQNRQDGEQIELENIQRQQSQSESCSSSRTDEQNASAADRDVNSDQEEENSPASTCSPAQLVGLNQIGLDAGSLNDRSRLAQILMSDNELISSTTSNCHDDSRCRRTRLPNRPRRRWRWNSFKLWLSQRSTCQKTRAILARGNGQGLNWTDEDDNESLTHNRTAGPPNAITSGTDSTVLGQANACDQQPATRYKSLKSNGRRRRSSGSNSTSGRTPSTLANVISLAKIDRVFRCRLLASLLVSAVLFALICLLVVIISRRSSMLSSLYAGGLVWRRLGSGSQLSLGPLGGVGDDFNLDEYDVSWLWSSSSPVGLDKRPALEEEVRQRQSTTGFDANLRSLLQVIDRSSRLDQLQSSLTHLSNLQLASDLHIDLVDLAAEVLAGNGDGDTHWQEDNSNRSASSTQRRDSANDQQQQWQTNSVKPNQSQLDLFALTLLSNLHWPLVKWRHQSQQPALTSSFLSFALPHLVAGPGNRPPPSLSAEQGGGGLQTIRSLLSSLILVESLNSQVTEQYANLQQIYKLHLNLRLVGYHLATCSQESDDDLDLLWTARDQDDAGSNGQFRSQRRRFCLLLVRRYRRMMMAISQLSHQDLAEFHRQRPVELAKSVFSPKSQHQTTSGRTVLNFLLDRLAPLDVRTLAEVTLTSGRFDAQDLNSLPLLDDLNIEFQNGAETGADLKLEGEATTSSVALAVEMLMTNQGQIELKSGQLVQTIASSQAQANAPKQDELYELVKNFVGDSPIKRLISNKLDDDDENTDAGGNIEGTNWQARYLSELTQISRQSSQWFDLLVYDLIAPWPSYKLPNWMRPHGYDLFLHPNLTTRLLLGVNKIEFELERPTSFLILNSAHLNLIDLSLWQRSANIVPAKQQNTQQTESPPPPTADKQIPIRRVLQLEQQEMLYIELETPLEPATSWRPSGQQVSNGFKSLAHHRVDFGEPPQADTDEPTGDQATRAYVKNQFLLSVSFNKTSLMSGQGAEFIKYADYFGGPGASVGQQQTGFEQAAGVNQEDEQNSMRALMFSTFNAFDASNSRKESNRLLARHSNPHQARRLVPCLDEPHFRARWQLNVVHDSSSQALANTQRRERLPYNSIGSLQMTIFEQTPVPLSPNLLSILVCDQNSIRSLASRVEVPEIVDGAVHSPSPVNRRHLQVSIWAQFELLNQAELASQLVPQLLTFYQNHLNFVYPLDKLDLVALPDWSSWPSSSLGETREGLGLLVLGGERKPLADVNLISQDLIERNSLQLAHQLAHQFFGNIVAPQQVSRDLWLFEALAEHLESLALGEVQPNWHLDEQFPVTSLQGTLVDDQLNGLIETSWNLPSKVVQENQTNGRVFDGGSRQSTWSIAKSSRRVAAIVHMLLQTLLPNSGSRARLFRNCLSSFQYSTMSTSQFWRLFAKQLLEESSASSRTMNSVLESEQFPRPLQLATDPASELSPPPTEVDLAAESHLDPDDTNSTGSERIVFVNRRRQQVAAGGHDDSHQVHATLDESVKQDEATPPRPAGRTGRLRRHQIRKQFQQTKPMRRRLVDRLELLADVWLNRAGFPLVTASCHRDSLHLRQEHFRFNPKWPGDEEEPALGQTAATAQNRRRRDATESIEGDELAGATWPIPLMFISRLNPGAARFVWFDRREMDISLDQSGDQSVALQSAASSSMGQASGWSAYNSMQQPPAGGSASAKLPQQYSWFKLNHNASALVRVNYDERNWEALISLLTRSHYSNHLLNPLDRANLLDDALTLMRYGQLSVNLAMNLTLYLELGERDYQPWQTIIRNLDQLQTLLNQNPWWHRYVLKLIQPISIVVGWKDDGPHLMRKLRRELYQLAIQYGDEKILAKARNEFRNWMQRASQFIVPNLKELVYVAGVRYGDQQEWFHCWQRYQQLVALTSETNQQQHNPVNRFAANQDTTQPAHAQLLQAAARSNSIAGGGSPKRGSVAPTGSNPLPAFEGANLPPELEAANDASLVENEQRQLLTALASTQNTWLLEQFLNYSLDSSKIRSHQLDHVVKTLGKNPVARLYLWRFVRLNWLELIQRFGHSDNEFYANSLDEQRDLNGEFQLDDSSPGLQKSILETMILESIKHFATRADYDEVSAFFETKRKLHNQQVWWGNSMERTICTSLATIRANIHWRNSIEPKLTRWLSNFNSILR